MIKSGQIIHAPDVPIRILGGDPGKATGLVLVEFRQRRRDGSPLWQDARLLSFAVVKRRDEEGATVAERDILFRRQCLDVVLAMRGAAPSIPIVALEEPVDGGQVYATNRAQDQRETNKIEGRGTSFRIGVAYCTLLAACAAGAVPNRVISFPVKNLKSRGVVTRRGWMTGTTRKGTLTGMTALMRSIALPSSYRGMLDKNGALPDHLCMALGVINHLVTNYLTYFPHP